MGKEVEYTHGRIALFLLVVFIALISIGLNCFAAIGRILLIRRKRTFNALDLLVTTLCIANILLSAFVYPEDVIAYEVLDGHWPYGNIFCHISTFLTATLPLISTWAIAFMIVQQLFECLAIIGNWRLTRNRWTEPAIKSLPLVAVLCIALFIHCPLAYSVWRIQVEPFVCNLNNPDTLHDTIWWVWMPLSITGLGLVLLIILVRVFRIHVRTKPPPSSSRSSLQITWMSFAGEEDEEALQDDVPRASPYLNGEPSVAPPVASSVEDLADNSSLNKRNIILVLGLFISILIFSVPHGTVELLLHHSDGDMDHDTLGQHFTAWHAGFVIKSLRPLMDALVVVGVDLWFRSLLRRAPSDFSDGTL